MSQKYADIIIDISHEAIDRTFQYKVPDILADTLEVGMQVEVSFGQGKRNRKGYVVSITDEPTFDPDRLKEISGISDKGLQIEGKLIKLAAWMREQYGSTMINALRTVMPVKEVIRKTATRIIDNNIELSKMPVSELTEEQRVLVDGFVQDIDKNLTKTYLLHGITGSGKTEIYIECIKKVVQDGKQAIVLIPEIGLTYQNVARFKQHFGERVAFINSKQSKGEKYREIIKAKNHEVDVIIGPRSALFTPCKKLGLIIIDEEHDAAYKSESTPRYHARETAIKRAQIEGATTILGSATPSIESYAKAVAGEYELWELMDRPDGMELPETTIVDLRDELHMGNRSIISKALYDMIEDRLKKREQIILFINKRGFNSVVSCRECGEVIKCPKCDVALVLHNNGFMMCHYCGHVERETKECPSCKSKMIGGFGTGTEKVEAEVKRLFPSAKTLRMDKDTTSKKGAHSDIISRFSNHEADILVGTQMIVKGHDFENVTLVGIMLADMSLFANDYMAGERTFDLITQAAGRAGRGEKKGDVLIQTYQPEHYAIASAAKQDYKGFFEIEMTYRRLLRYPPVYDMMVIYIASENEELLDKETNNIHKYIKENLSEGVRIVGPSDALIGKINNVYRKVIYIKTQSKKSMIRINDYIEKYQSEKISITIDINPVNTY